MLVPRRKVVSWKKCLNWLFLSRYNFFKKQENTKSLGFLDCCAIEKARDVVSGNHKEEKGRVRERMGVSVCMCLGEQCSHPPIHLLWPRGVLSREHLPDWYLFLGPKEKGSLLSPSYSYRCQMEDWPRESLNGGRPEFNQTMEIREQRKAGNDMLNNNHLWSWMIIPCKNFSAGVFHILSTWW